MLVSMLWSHSQAPPLPTQPGGAHHMTCHAHSPPWAGTGPVCQTLQQLAQELKGTYENHSWTQTLVPSASSGLCVSSSPSFCSQVCPCGPWARWVRVYTQWQCTRFYPIRGCPWGSCKSRTSTRRPDYGAEWIECQVCFSVVCLCSCLRVATEYLNLTNSSQECNPLSCCPAAEGQWYTPLPPRLLFSRKRKKK